MTRFTANCLPGASMPEGAFWFNALQPTANMTEFSSVSLAEICKRRDVGEQADEPGTTDSREQADFCEMIPREVRRLVEEIEVKLEEDRADAEQGEDPPPNPVAVSTCLGLAEQIARHIALAPRLKWGAFTEDDGGVSLVIQSLVTDRRVDCRIDPDGSAVSAIRINECMHADSVVIPVGDTSAPRELAEWVTSRA